MAIKVAGELYYDIDGQLAEIKRQLRQSAGYPYDPAQLKVALQNAIEGKFTVGAVRESAAFSVVATTALDAIAGKKTKSYFTGEWYRYRDKDFDQRLPTNQQDASACTIATLAFEQTWTFKEAAAQVLRIPGTSSLDMLSGLLRMRGHTMTLAQAENMVERTDRGEATGMRTGDRANLFFVENEDGSVSGAGFDHIGRVWGAYVFGVANVNRWSLDARLLVRNLDTKAVGL